MNILNFDWDSWHKAPKTLDFPGYRSAFFPNEMAFAGFLDSHRMGLVAKETNHVIRGLELSGPFIYLQEWERDWRLIWSPMANEEINHAYVRKSPLKPKGTGFKEFLDCWMHGSARRMPRKDMKALLLFPYTLPYAFLSSGCSYVPYIIKQQI